MEEINSVSTSIENWIENFEAVKAHVAQTGHFPNKHTRLTNWCRYQRKRIKAGPMPDEQKALFEALAASRSGEHTGGRKEEKMKLRGNNYTLTSY